MTSSLSGFRVIELLVSKGVARGYLLVLHASRIMNPAGAVGRNNDSVAGGTMGSLMNPICSVVIPAFNVEEYVREAIDSVLTQECDFDFEIIVVDDGSTDHTSDIVRGYGDKVRLIRKENGGPGSARNVGAAQTRADILVFLDADDRMLPGRLAYQVGFMLKHPNIGLTFGNRLLENAPAEDPNCRYGLPFTEDWRILDRPYPKLIVEVTIYSIRLAPSVDQYISLLEKCQPIYMWVRTTHYAVRSRSGT